MKNKIRIKSGFKSGGELLAWEGGKFVVQGTVSSCTWQDDVDDSQEWELPQSFKGAAVRWRTDGHTRLPSAQLLGFSEEELSSPPPVQGWGMILVAHNAARYDRLATLGQYLEVLAEHGEDGILTDDTLLANARQFPGGRAVVQIPYEWGCQEASHFAVFQDDVLVGEEKGCGDNTPYLDGDGEILYPGW